MNTLINKLESDDFIDGFTDMIIGAVPNLGQLIYPSNKEKQSSLTRELKVVKGYCELTQLLYIPGKRGITIEKCFLSKKTVTYEHSHDVDELFICYRGKVYIKPKTSNFKTNINYKILKPGESYLVPKNLKHYILTPEDSSIICIFIPAEKGFKIK